MTVDQKVYELGCSFLPERATDAEKQWMAERIQMAIEEFLIELEEAEFQRSQQAVNELPGA